MRILIVHPSPPGVSTGNAITAARWKRILESLGHEATLDRSFRYQPCDLLIALHAIKSGPSIDRWIGARPTSPLIVALTGTDIYGESALPHAALEAATAIVALQPAAKLPPRFAKKLAIIPQSAEPCPDPLEPSDRQFTVAVVGHLRDVKDPMLAASASRLVPDAATLRIDHYGRALERKYAAEARREQRENPRYRWHGELPHGEVRRRMTASHLLAVTSRSEGGANVISEALADMIPILATRIPGNVGILGPRYPGLFTPGDEFELARLLTRAEFDSIFLARLRFAVARLRGKAGPDRERQAWRRLLLRVSEKQAARPPRPR